MIDQVSIDGGELAYMVVIVVAYTAIIASLAYSFGGGGSKQTRPAAPPPKWDEILASTSEKAATTEPIRNKLDELPCHCGTRGCCTSRFTHDKYGRVAVEGAQQPIGVLFGANGTNGKQLTPSPRPLRIAEGTWPEEGISQPSD